MPARKLQNLLDFNGIGSFSFLNPESPDLHLIEREMDLFK
jgi:hypothetical protein